MEKKTDQEGFEMLVVVQNGTLSPEEQAYYVRRVTEKFPRGVVERTAAPSPPAGRRSGPRKREAVRYSAAPGPHRY